MKYTNIHARELTSEMIGRWAEIQSSDAALANPYFCPEFTVAVAAVRDDVRVGILEDGNRKVGFFPFQCKRGGVARPVALGLSDYHGIIVEPQAEWSAEAVMRGCKITRWEFDHLPVSQRPFAPFVTDTFQSPVIDVSHGFQHYLSSIGKSARKQHREAARKREKLAAAFGPVKFIPHTRDKDILRQMFAWKSRQCRETGSVDYFALSWCVKLIERLQVFENIHFGGLLACLYVGEKLAAVHFLMHSRHVWHSWFPAYNEAFKEYSPGLILLYELIKAASEAEIRYIDLGKGMSLYKKRVMTGAIEVAQGCIELPSVQNRLYHILKNAEQYARRSAFKPLLAVPGRYFKNLERKNRYE